MASTSPGTNFLNKPHFPGCDDSPANLAGSFVNGSRQLTGFPPKDGMSSRDSGYSVSTSDGASTCSSSTTDPAEGDGGTLLVLEPKSLRSFTTNDEYLYAMKEDLADWFCCLYKFDVTADNFFSILETGVLLCQHANKVQEFSRQRREQGDPLEMRSYFIRNVPERNVPYKANVKPETFQARDNVSNFISWGRQLGIPEVLSFETDDLVLRKNEKSVILCLLEIARVGAKLGMLAPTLVQMEEEIDAELAGEEVQPQVQIKTCDMRSLDEMVRDLVGRCTCPIQFPMVKVGDGKYKIGDSRSLIFVRILRNHVMVRVGGGWDTLENYLNKHDPCQCNYRGHRGAATVAHKVSINQQRRASTPSGNSISSTRHAPANTTSSPRRTSVSGAVRNRSTSPRSKSPTLVISRQQAEVQRSEAVCIPASVAGHPSSIHHPMGAGISQSWSQYSGQISNSNSNNSNQLGNQPTRCKSPSPGRLRSPSPLTTTPTKSATLPRPAISRAASSSAILKRKGQGSSDVKVGTPRSIKREAMISNDQEEEDEYDYPDGIVTEETPFLPSDDRLVYTKYDDDIDDDDVTSDLEEEYDDYLIPGSVSFDEKAEHVNGLDRESDDAGQVEGRKANMSMDKISTMTLSEFKSLLGSALSVPEDTAPSQKGGITSTASTPGAVEGNRQLNWGSVRDKARSVRDSISSTVGTRRPASGHNSPAVGRRSLPQSPDSEPTNSWPRTPQSMRKPPNGGSSSSTTASTATARPKTPSNISRPKTPTAVSRPKTPSGIPTFRPKTPTSTEQKTGQKDEYQMARPKTPSQMKREAVAKVAGAISNWVESRSEIDSSTPQPPSIRPKTPTRHTGPSASLDVGYDKDENDEDGDEVASALSNPDLSSSVRDRPGTPSRIPKPCFLPRPVTPKTTGSDVMSISMGRERSVSSSPPVPPQTLSLSQNLSESFSVSTGSGSSGSTRTKSVISRVVHSNSSNNSPVMSPHGSLVHEPISKSSNLQVRAASGRTQPQTPNSDNSGMKSYKDIHTAKRSTTPGPYYGSVPRSQPSRCVTPGPREKWSLGENSKNHTNSRSIDSNSKAKPQRRGSLSNGTSPLKQSNSSSVVHSDQIMVTNEITFSDDEEINEMMKNAAMQSAKPLSKPGPRSASVDAKRLVRQNASAGQEVLVISRNNAGKHCVQVNRKNSSPAVAVKRPPSRGSSTDRVFTTSSAAGRFRSQTPDPSMFRRKLSSARSIGSNDTNDSAPAIPKSGEKSFNRTEAWVDSTLSDPKRKLPSRPKRGKTIGGDIPISELESRPLEEIKAMLTEPQQSSVQTVDADILEAPPEDAEMFKKMEKLFEKYREMELRASVNDTPGAGTASRSGVGNSAVEAPKTSSHRSLNASSRSTPSVTSLKTSSGSHGSSSGGRLSNPPPVVARSHANRPASARSSSREDRFKRSTSNPGSFQKSNSGSPAVLSPAQESNFLPETNHSINGASGVISSLRDIDSEVAKDPAALISKIKEILRVRPRKDENSQIPTRIPAPKGFAKTKRSKSVSNLFQTDGMSSDFTLASSHHGRADDDSGINRQCGSERGSKLNRANSSSNTNIAYSEFIFTDQNESENCDVLTEMARKTSVHSDSGDSSSRCETPAPKLATPLTTGRSTFINRKGGLERMGGRSLSQDKENTLSNSQTSLSSRSVLSTTEDEADYV